MNPYQFHVDPRHKGDASEIAIQAKFRRDMATAAPKVILMAIPNGGRRTAWEKRQRGKEGMIPGAPDIIALHDGRTAFMEFKTGTGTLSDTQVDCLNRLMRSDFPVGVFRSAETAIDWLSNLWPTAFLKEAA